MGEKSNWGYEIKFPQSLFAQSIGHQVTFMMTATGHNNSTENDGRIQIYLFDNYTPTELEKGTFLPYVANQLAFTFDKTGAGVIDVGATTTLTHTMTVTQQNSVNLSLFVPTGYLHFDGRTGRFITRIP